MAIPSKLKLTPAASVTTGHGISTDASSEFWQLVSKPGVAPQFIVYENVPTHLANNILESADPDTAIRLQLAGKYRTRASIGT